MHKLFAVSCFSSLAMMATATSFGPGTDMATLNDYYYYVANPGAGRAGHSANAAGSYSLSADKTWSQLSLSSSAVGSAENPVLFDLGGHTLTLVGCDVSDKPLLFKQANATTVVSNGTLATVYDQTTYPWTNEHPEWYQYRRGGTWGGGNATVIIEKDGEIACESGTTFAVNGDGNRLVVRNGGNLNSKVGWSGKDNRVVFEKGATFGMLSSFVSGGSFPQSVWMESGHTSNMFEVCDSKFLTDKSVTKLTPDMNVKAGSFHCGLAVATSDFDFTGALGTVGGGAAPVLFEILRGAKVSVSAESFFGGNAAASGSRVNVDGEGSTFASGSQWGGRLGMTTGCSNNVLQVSNGANFDLSYPGNWTIGYGTDSSFNEMRVLSGSHFRCGTLIVGKRCNIGNRLVISGEGTTSTNKEVQIGGSEDAAIDGCGGHSIRVADGAELFCPGTLHLGNQAPNNVLTVDDATAGFSRVYLGAEVPLSYGNRLEVVNGATFENSANIFEVKSPDSAIVVSNATLITKQLMVQATGSNLVVTIAGKAPLFKTTTWGHQFTKGAKIKFCVPKNGYAAAPINGNNYVLVDETCSLEVDAMAFLESDDNIIETDLMFSASSAPLQLNETVLANATVTPGCVLRLSADKKTLRLRRKNRGFVILYR